MHRLLLLFTAFLYLSTAQSQSIYTEFGKNRIQYHDDFENWWMYETENFITYWYGKGRNVAKTVIQMAELDNDEIQSVLEHRFNDKIEIIVYLDLSDLKQSNLGSEELFTSTTGQTKILGNKMFVYFDGDHQVLRQRIRQGIAGVYLESMLYGTNLQEIVQNAVLLNLPDWYRDGLIEYLGQTWTPEVEDQLRDLYTHPRGKYHEFARMARDYPTIAGHAMWYYIGRAYGKSSISNLLYLTRINRNLENAFLYVLGVDFKQIVEEWEAFFEQRFQQEVSLLDVRSPSEALPIRNKRNIPYTQLELSPDGRTLAYVQNDVGKVKMYFHDIPTGKSARIEKYGIRNNVQEADVNYPVMAWREDGQHFSYIHEIRDVLYLTQIDLQRSEQVTELLGPDIQRVYSLSYWHPDTLIMSASTDGFSDLYKYMPKTRQSERITEDFFDDLEASVATVAGEKGILFRSNRMDQSIAKRSHDTILPIENFDIFFLRSADQGWELSNLTQTPLVNEISPKSAGPQAVIYLSGESGVWNRKIINNPLSLQSTTDFLTNYDHNILLQSASAQSGETYEYLITEGKHLVFRKTIDSDAPIVVIPRDNSQAPEVPGKDEVIETNRDEHDVVDERYLFQSEFKGPPEIVEEIPPTPTVVDEVKIIPEQEQLNFLRSQYITEPVTHEPSEIVEFISARAIAHRLKFKLDFVNTTMDNSLLFSSLDTYAGTKRQYDNPPLGILLKANVKDLFEDYVIEGGARYPTSFNGSEYFIFMDDKKKRIDKRYAFYRKTTIESENNGIFGPDRDQFVTVIGQVRLSYPLDVYTSVRATGTVRNDRLINLATDASTLEVPIDDQQRLGLQLEFVYDNTVEIDMNYRHGTRYKVWAELVKRFDLNLFEGGENLTFNKGFMTVLGVDARHYQRLDKHSILATRFYASTSLGSERNLYYLGGVENWLFGVFDNTIPVPGDKNFAYQTIAANMRGFKYNARNGASVVLMNTELRVPFLRYLSKSKIKSSFLRHLQVVGFVDVGTAWHGSDPFSDENPLNTLTLNSPPTVSVDIKYFRNPIVAGYGAGVRTLLFGYFLKLDYAWGWETKRVRDPILHFSMGTDF